MPLTPILKKANMMSPASCKKVLFCTRETARSVILKYRESREALDYVSAFQTISMSGSEAERLSWLAQMTECVPLLDQKVDTLVLEFLKIPWYKSESLAVAAESFIIALVTAHNYYTYHVLKQLFTFLIPAEDPSMALTEILSEAEESCCRRIITSIVAIRKHVPMSQDYILMLARKCMPYFRRSTHDHVAYTHGLLLLAGHLPHLRVCLLEVIVTNMITIDVHTPRSELANEIEEEEEEDDSSDEEEMFDMEVEERSDKQSRPANSDARETSEGMSHKDGNTLDTLMTIVLQYIHDVCHGVKRTTRPSELQRKIMGSEESYEVCRPGIVQFDETNGQRTVGCECKGTKHDLEALKMLFTDLKEVFSRIILSTHASSHTQFLVFYLLALRPGLATIFLEFLRVKKFENPNCFRDQRRNAMAYIGSLLARGKFIPFSHVHSCLEVICMWCSSYLDKQEVMRATNYEDLYLHSPFYFACQTVFYVFTFRYREYTENPKKLALARSLNLERLVLSQLNPLRVCAAPIVSNFAAVTRRFQLAYCYTIMENNKRLQLPTACIEESRCSNNTTLDTFFPFDPYLLHRSKGYIVNHYREFDGLPEDVTQEEGQAKDKDEEAMDIMGSPKSFDFSYSCSPGYQAW